jgi:ParB/RepB/Spo0J family partition protein
MAATEPKKTAKSEERRAKSETDPDLSPFAPCPSPEVVRISHACGHVVHCPREFMPPGRLKRERARNCRSCRKIAREVAALRNQERGLPPLDETRGTRDQILLAEELRDRFWRELCADPFVDNADPIRWIARFAGQEDCLLETRGPEVCGRACAGEALAEEDAQFDRIFGDGPREPEPPDAGSQEPRACWSCGTVEDPHSRYDRLEEVEGSLFCFYCARQAHVEDELEAARREQIRSIIDEDAPTAPGEPREHPAPKVALIGLARIQPSPLNPRKRFDEAGLEGLAASIREHGVMQPLVVRQEGAEFSVIAGERRLRAARLAGLLNVPVIVREADDAATLSMMLVENLQRENLNPIEEAQAYQGLRDLGWTLEQIGAKVGRSGPAVSNAMRLLALPEEVRAMVGDGRLSAAHGRALLAWADQPEQCAALADYAIGHELTSKALENQSRLRRGEMQRYEAERAAIATEEGAEAGSKGGAAGEEIAHAQPVAQAWEAVDERQARAEGLRRRERQEYEAARAQWPARAGDLAAGIAHERERAGSILMDRRAVGLLAYNLLQDHRLCVLQEILAERGLGNLLPFFDWSADPMFAETWAALSALPVETQLELAFEALMREEIHLLREGGTEPEQSAWYVGDGCAAASEGTS